VDGSELVFILMPVIIPLSLAIGIVAPYIADSRSNKRLSSKHRRLRALTYERKRSSE
jgi:hypothetical protein